MTAKKKSTKKKTSSRKKTASKRSSKKAANDNLPPMPPAMPGQQEHIPETLTEVVPGIQDAARELDEARKAAAGWGRETQNRLAVLEKELEKAGVEGTYYDGVVKVVRSVKNPKPKLEVEVIDSHLEAAE